MKTPEQEISTRLMNILCASLKTEELKIVQSAVSIVLHDYDVSYKPTSLVPYQYTTPQSVQSFIVAKKVQGCSKGTLSLYLLTVNSFFAFAKKDVTAVTRDDIRAFLYYYGKQNNVSDATLESKRSILNSFFTWATDEELILKNPCSNVSAIKCEHKERQYLSQYNLEQLRSACQTNRERAMVDLLYSTGCRISELSALKVSDIDFQKQEVHLFGKGKKHRTSYLNAKAAFSVSQHLKTRKQPSAYVMQRVHTAESDLPLSKGALEKAFRKIVARAGLNVTEVTPHVMRHTFATTAMQNGMAINEIQTILGHADPATTLIYAKSCAEQIKLDHRKYVV